MEPTLEQIEQLLENKKYQEVITLLSDTLLTYHNNATLYGWRARAHGGIGDTEASFIYAQKSIEIDPLLAIGYFIRGNAQHKKKEYDKAILDYTEAIRLDPNYANAYRNRGLSRFNKKEYDKAIIDYTEAIRLDPNHTIAYFNRGDALYNKKEYNKAILDYTEAIRLDPNYANAYRRRGLSRFNKKEYDKAIIDYTEAIRLHPNHAITYFNRGDALYNKKEYDKAIIDFTEAIRLDPNYTIAYIYRGNVLASKEEYDKAILDYTEAIRLDPNYVITFRNRGLTWSNKKEYNKAILDYTEAIRLDPNHANAYGGRGLTLSRKGEYNKAILDYTEAIRLDPNNVAVHYNRGLTWYNKKEYDEAIVDFTEAIRLDPNHANAYFNRGNSFYIKKEYSKAIADYKRYVDLKNDSNNYNTQVTLAKIEELNKRIKNAWYDEIDSVIDEIKQILLFDSPCLTHYTSLSGARAMILHNSPFRLSEGSFLNDTSEGRELFNYLSFEIGKRTTDATIAELFVERPFIGSFVADNKHNDLTLWRMYGKEAQAEAKGCALTIFKANFIDDLKKRLSPADTKAGIQSQSEEQFTFYNVAYLLKDKFIIPGKSNLTGDQLNELMGGLKSKIKKLTKNQKVSISKVLNGIAYLFKSSEYQYENEVRLVVQGVGFTKKIEDNPPKVYIELVDVVPTLHKITLGPKVERADEWAAAFNYHIKNQLKEREEKVEIIISHLPFK